MLDQIREGDVIVVWKLDRLRRSTRDLLHTSAMESARPASSLAAKPFSVMELPDNVRGSEHFFIDARPKGKFRPIGDA